jgi:hypothetical protein
VEPGSDFGLCRLDVAKDLPSAVAFSVNQVNSRFVDETMRGYYEYAECNLIITRLIKDKDPKTGAIR